MSRQEPESLPTGWEKVKRTTRPTYRRRDGYTVKLDNPQAWGIRAPGENRPFTKRPDAARAMAHVDENWPLEEVGP